MNISLESVIDRAKREILADIISRKIPNPKPASFGDLHDSVDANEYGGLCEESTSAELAKILPAEPGDAELDAGALTTQRVMRFANRVQDALNEWIVGGGIGAELLVAAMRRHYPAAGFEVTTKAQIGCDEFVDAPEFMVTFCVEECIFDPLSSECGRFMADPELTYGIAYADALAIRAHNRAELA